MDSETMITATHTEILPPPTWVFPVPIAYGPGRLTKIGSTAAALSIMNAPLVTEGSRKDVSCHA